MKQLIKIIVFIFSLFINLKLFSKEAYKFCLSPLFYLQNGSYNEFVYIKDSFGNEQKVSELNWSVKNLIQAGAQFIIEASPFQFDFELTFGFKNKLGKISDSDWLNYEGNFNYIDPNMKTNLSNGETTINQNINAKILVSYEFPIDSHFSFLPYASFNYSLIDYKGSNFFGWYGDKDNSLNGENVWWYSEYAKFYDRGYLGDINYRRHSFYTFLGFTNKINYNKWGISYSFGFSPFLYTESEDIHFLTYSNLGTKYLDRMYGFFSSFLFDFTYRYNFNKQNSLNVYAQYLIQNPIDGVTFTASLNNTNITKTNSISKCSTELFSFSIKYSYKF